MNTMMTVDYNGGLRCSGTHVRSGNKLTTDAPLDNNGKGEAFSPTDLLCTSLACCMITVMGIAAEKKDIEIGSIHADIEKIMETDPRRVGEIKIHLKIEDKKYGFRERRLLEAAAKSCPVVKSLSSELKQTITFEYV